MDTQSKEPAKSKREPKNLRAGVRFPRDLYARLERIPLSALTIPLERHDQHKKSAMTARNHLAETALDQTEIAAACLNIEAKDRSNLFPWNGQFSPQFVEVMLNRYAREGGTILYPFCGSGTVLAEASRLGLAATGIELNPAAYILARTYSLANIHQRDRVELLNLVEHNLQELLPKGWPLLIAVDSCSSETYQAALPVLLTKASIQERVILEALIILADFFKGTSAQKLAKTWGKLRQTVEQFPYSKALIALHHADGRYPESSKLFDMVFTSPPYINVYNYHQQYRASAEALGWDLLHVAKTEIGSNRKNRGNRFLTVTQYCLDLAICLSSLWSATKNNARIIFVMGRESRVRGIPFFNGEIAASLAVEAIGYRLALRQERVFTNRFGQRIFEDILHFQKPQPEKPSLNYLVKTRNIAELTLRAGLEHVGADDVKNDLLDAIRMVSEVTESPSYIINPNTNIEIADVISDATPRKAARNSRER